MRLFQRDRTPRSQKISKALEEPVESAVSILNGDEDAATPVEVEKLGKLARLHPFSPVAVSVVQLFDREDTSTHEIARLLQSDPALAAETLAYVNSPLFAVPESITDLHSAIMVLGSDNTKRLAATLAMRGMLKSAPKPAVTRRLWRHSLATAAIASELAPLYDVAPDLANTAGILHDIGRVGLLSKDGDTYAQVILGLHEDVDAILAAESASCGMNHCVAGACMCRVWGLPAVFEQASSRHHEARGELNVAGLINIACALADDMSFTAISHRGTKTVAERIAGWVPEQLQQKAAEISMGLERRIADKVQELDF